MTNVDTMRLIGVAAPGLYLFDVGAGAGRLLHVRDDELVLFQSHPLDPELVDLAEPCHEDEATEAERLALVVLAHGESDSECSATTVLHRSQLAELRPVALPSSVTAA